MKRTNTESYGSLPKGTRFKSLVVGNTTPITLIKINNAYARDLQGGWHTMLAHLTVERES